MASGIQLLIDMWAHVGPGLLLAFATPALVVLLALVILSMTRQVRARAGVED